VICALKRPLIYYLLIFLCFIPTPYLAPAGITAFIILMIMYMVMSESWNLLGGYLGDLSFGHAVFFGIGAYTVALLEHYGISNIQPFNILLAGISSMGLAALIGYPFLRLKGFYFAIGTLGLSEIFRLLFRNSDITLGPKGIMVPVPLPYTIYPYFYGILGIAIGSIFIIYLIENSKLGLAFLSIKDDIDAARMVGVRTTAYRILGFSLSAFFVGIVGGFFAYFNSYVHPDGVFSMLISFELILMVYFGGVGTFLGPLLGAAVVLFAEELGRVLIQQGYLLLLSIMLILTFVFMPSGVIGIFTRRESLINPFKRS